MFKINILLYLLPNILLLNLKELYIYDYQILDSFGISEFAQCSNLNCMAKVVPSFSILDEQYGKYS